MWELSLEGEDTFHILFSFTLDKYPIGVYTKAVTKEENRRFEMTD